MVGTTRGVGERTGRGVIVGGGSKPAGVRVGTIGSAVMVGKTTATSVETGRSPKITNTTPIKTNKSGANQYRIKLFHKLISPYSEIIKNVFHLTKKPSFPELVEGQRLFCYNLF
jgi:hypothetical protein